ncbi:MAG: hypothetical protein ABEK10_01305 [Candidatus Nanosalina sp.]
MDNSSSKDLEWNIGKHRIEFIGRMTTQVRENFHSALKYPTQGNVKKYLDSLETLYFDIRGYIKDDELQEELDQEIENARSKVEAEDPEEVLSELKPVDEKIQDKRLDLGLDIPSKTSPDSLLD